MTGGTLFPQLEVLPFVDADGVSADEPFPCQPCVSPLLPHPALVFRFEDSPKLFEGLPPVLRLAPFLGARHDGSAFFVDEAHACLDFVHVLPSVSARAEELPGDFSVLFDILPTA